METRRFDLQVINRPEGFTTPRNPEHFFTLNARSGTKLGRPSNVWTGRNEFTAPMLCKSIRGRFVLCEVTITARLALDGDQAGIALFLDPISGRHRTHSPSRGPAFNPFSDMKWTRVAVEQRMAGPAITALVAKPRLPLERRRSVQLASQGGSETMKDCGYVEARLKLEKVGNALWVWYKTPYDDETEPSSPSPAEISQQWTKCDELPDFFYQPMEKSNLFIACYASRPSQSSASAERDSGLTVNFHELDIL